MEEDKEGAGIGRDGFVVGHRLEGEFAAQVEAVEARRVLADQLFLEMLAERGGGFFGEVDAEEVEDADGQPGQAAFVGGCPARRQAADFPAAVAIAGRRRAEIARQVVHPAPQHEAVVEFDADDGIAADFHRITGAVAGGARRQAEQRLRAADATATDFLALAAQT